MDNKELHRIYRDNIIDAKKILDSFGIKFWLDSGTLLGAYREGHAIEGDEDDIDLVTHCQNRCHLQKIIKSFEEKGFTIKRQRETIISFERKKNHVDIFFANYTKEYFYLTMYWQKKPFALVVPKHFWQKMTPIEYYGQKFLAPRNVEEYLIFAYGNDWRTPNYRPEYQNYNPDHQKRANWTFLQKSSIEQYEKRMKKETDASVDQAMNSLKKENLSLKYVQIDKKTRTFNCPLCNEWHCIGNVKGQECLDKINRN